MWINDAFIDTIGSITAQGDANALFPFPNGSIIPAQDNVVTVLQDHMGNDEGQNRKFSSRPVPSHTMQILSSSCAGAQRNRTEEFAASSS